LGLNGILDGFDLELEGGEDGFFSRELEWLLDSIDEKNSNVAIPFQAKVTSQISNAKKNQPASTFAVSETVVGNTLYDLQSNGSVGDRIVVNADGSIATCWTIEPTDGSGSYANRGTGYNYFNGSTWGAAPTARIENARVGWGNVADTRTKGEIGRAHV
jgi:hypothetical protein